METVESLRHMIWRKSFRAKGGSPSMRGLVFLKEGKERKVELIDDVKLPKLTTTQVLIKVHYAALNSVDLVSKAPSEPVGVEFVGVIEKLGWVGGDKVHMFPFAIGQVVFGMCESGALSEFVCGDADKISYRPDGMADEQAAAFSVSGLTAHQGLKFNKFAKGQTIMVIGASNATGGMFARQARLLGAEKVILADYGNKLEALESIDADALVNLDEQTLAEVVAEGECNLIVDAISDPRIPLEEGQLSFETQSYTLLARGGKFLLLNANPLDQLRKIIANSIGLNVQRRGFDTVLLQPNGLEIKQLAEWFEAGLLEQSIDSSIDFEDTEAINEAYKRLQANEECGKIIVKFPGTARLY
ncbi:Alcohol dehydrogenase 1 [Hondaea fermentalgiana]|uniref:Alcohol dehydrogenase 1 n=1 Tax=Hondaea fermentalgiana TaxID=2315210 RepID=A0A2R5H221_9STRA|nr:Alcohol dehydrogenase 1 [Hondaea fermentalgiana]|eukprot:GBG34881.1 Alcohol dehydrogenase 1 [Hondaea fermentalgiana]